MEEKRKKIIKRITGKITEEGNDEMKEYEVQ